MKNIESENKLNLNEEMLNAVSVQSEEELKEIFGAGGSGILHTVSHECSMNTWQFLFTCC